MPVDQSRRSLLFGRKPAVKTAPIFRPPWAIEQFTEQCTRCGECLSACPSQIIVAGDGGFPEIDFSRGECTFCGECRDACQPKALSLIAEMAWAQHIEIASDCMAQQGVDCRVCGEMCDAKAIHFQLSLGRVAQPIIESDLCTGCGACVAPCPSAAIKMVQRQAQTMEA
ncbi:ferredoxin-type protein NapF [Chitinibacter bivalviorum]|uniref:Ferredoxin-type protein NapF n=1 Tax=Chitinibacter bivalviorum TaxID=2739434 RepID=A0A7H9BIG8_9NEIS|nr:ferredoxin-type protein NapF [Chitinibacter bivalviorum]QLG87751.1 ferredoxin-type protein NapF [Chitinibacter bivalviorum]